MLDITKKMCILILVIITIIKNDTVYLSKRK